MNNLFSFLNLSLWAVNKSCLRSHSIIIGSSCKTSSSLWNFSRGLIDCYDISCNDFLFLYCLNHFLTQVINCLHFSCFQCNFTCFWSRCWRFFYFDLYYLSFNYFALLFYSNSDWSTESLSQCFCFTHL